MSWNLRRAFYAALTGVVLAIVAPKSVAAPDIASGTQVARLAGAETSPAPSTAAAPFTLYLEDASGNAFRLVRVEGSGWKYADGWEAFESRAKTLLQEVKYEPSRAAEQPTAETSNVGEPLTVFIDGPSGFTFVYNHEGGWKFVGKLADRRE
jgi:hypothetical protein